ncbi:MAG: DUF6444 domain-containing protein [Isosphaeraceae bacterium]
MQRIYHHGTDAPIPEPLRNTASPQVQAAILALVAYYEQRLAQLEERVKDLENRLKLNSTNSSKPPSSDPIGLKRKPPRRPVRRSVAASPDIVRPTASWSHPRRSATRSTASQVPVAAAVMSFPGTTTNR